MGGGGENLFKKKLHDRSQIGEILRKFFLRKRFFNLIIRKPLLGFDFIKLIEKIKITSTVVQHRLNLS